MNRLSEKIYIPIHTPAEDASVGDREQLLQTLAKQGFEAVTLPLPVLRRLYPLCRKTDYTVTLARREQDWVIVDLEAGDTRGSHYGLAVDYGSTTILMALVDMNSGTVIHTVRAVNGQTVYGTDILSRITYAREDPAHMDELHRVTADTFHALLDELTEAAGIEARRCPVMALSGNTTMIHFLLQLDAWTVFAAPYAPVSAAPGAFFGTELGLDFEGLVHILPAASNYIGGDIISGLLALGLHKQEETSLFFDIGTNGELVIGNQDWLLAGAGAAGPALEGYISRFGMRAAPGAVDSVRIQKGNLTFTTIENRPPVGICGSGIIDLLAQLRLSGWMDIAGQLVPGASERIVYLPEERQYAAVYATAGESADGQPRFFTQTDIHQYLDTKAAAYTMVDCLLETAGVSADELGHLYLSGAFAAHSDLGSAITVGIFPDLPRERYTVLSNTSLDGARLLLLDADRLEEARRLSQSIYCVQFASIPDFLIRMQAAKFVPHTDMSRYPSVAAACR